MTEKSRHEPSLADLQRQLSAARDRAHKSGERAAQQFSKLLGTVEGGLGVVIAAWLQRIFEHARGPLSPLAGFLAVALFFDVLGLVALALIPLLDERCASHAARSTILNTTRAWHHEQRKHIESMPAGDERSQRELSFAEEDAGHVRDIEAADARARRINALSERLEVCSWVALCAAFVALGVGIVRTLQSL